MFASLDAQYRIASDYLAELRQDASRERTASQALAMVLRTDSSRPAFARRALAALSHPARLSAVGRTSTV